MSGDAEGMDARAEGPGDLSRRDVFKAGAAAAAVMAGLSLLARPAEAAGGGRRVEVVWRVVVGSETVTEIATVAPGRIEFGVNSYADPKDGWYTHSVSGIQPFQVVIGLNSGAGTVLPAWFDATVAGSDDVREVLLEMRSRAGDLLRTLRMTDARVVRYERPPHSNVVAGRALIDAYTLQSTSVEIL